MFETPNRIHILLEDVPERTDNGNVVSKQPFAFLICDYVFPDETDEDISDRVREMFAFDIKKPCEQIIYVEDLPRE